MLYLYVVDYPTTIGVFYFEVHTEVTLLSAAFIFNS